MTLQDLAISHPYYSSDSNYYSKDAAQTHETWQGFYEGEKNLDIDLNLCFRFDVKHDEETGLYCAYVFIIQQRKGIYRPVTIYSVTEEDVPTMIEYLQRHYDKIKELWQPFSSLNSSMIGL
jgi:hypothetical protein